MKELLVATTNRGKLKEIEALLSGCVERLYSLADFPDLLVVEEDGATFEENAVKKARSAAQATGKPTIADDSGLVVAALGGQPGVHSARFAGVDATDADNNVKLLHEMSAVPAESRKAAFRCVVALCFPDGACRTFSGELPGTILFEQRGTGGFGYDPLFYIPGYDGTLAELPLEAKNAISHRGKAMAGLKEFLSSDSGLKARQ
ncbi:MAG: XTP/dITP diphosphatase [Geobacter sp.]|nr:XTP/dITP diphosphatase [Geobacter sp.]